MKIHYSNKVTLRYRTIISLIIYKYIHRHVIMLLYNKTCVFRFSDAKIVLLCYFVVNQLVISFLAVTLLLLLVTNCNFPSPL